jgi:FtsP/CotA-like multicopper oxidase with cupredoxin domain
MNCMMAGMAPVMVLLMMGRDMRAMWPGEALFWMVMSLGVIAGFAVAYPINVWLVAQGMKHGLMTERAKANPEATRAGTRRDASDATSSEPNEMAGMDHGAMQMANSSAKGPKHASADAKAQKKAGRAGDRSEEHEMGNMPMAGRSGMETDVTRAQLVTITLFTLLMLVAGMSLPAAFVNLRLSAHDVRGAIMPPGMIMTQETPAAAMLDMAAVDPRDVTATYGLDRRGAQPLEPRIDNSVKVFELETSVIRWQILPAVSVNAYAFNGQVPGPTLRFRQGDRVRINVTNRLPNTTTVHWHGLVLPNVMDGAARITQAPIENGQVYRYEFTAIQAGSFFYHSHDHVDRQQALGLYGALIIDPSAAEEVVADHEYTILLQEWLIREGLTYPAMPMDGGQPNYFTINGRAFPATDMIRMKVGETLKVRFIGSSSGFIHPMHIHGGPFVVVARDGETLAPSGRFKADTLNVGPGQRYDVIWTALKPGKWMIHCHISHHTTNNNTEQDGGGGLMMHIEVEGDPTK